MTTKMGNYQTSFTEDQLDAYQDCTFFTREEILRIFERFRQLSLTYLPFDFTGNESSTITIPYKNIETMAELKENPFRRRMCEVFSVDGSGNMTFDDFLDMFSVLSEAAPIEIKTAYAFKIYDFDNDNLIGKSDIEKTIGCLTKGELTPEEVEFAIDKVLEEADLDDDDYLSYMEFEHVISRAVDFVS